MVCGAVLFKGVCDKGCSSLAIRDGISSAIRDFNFVQDTGLRGGINRGCHFFFFGYSLHG